jgi:hypothetical protein
VAFGVLVWMIRAKAGLVGFDLGVARFAAKHADPTATQGLRDLSQLGGAVFLGPFAVVMCIALVRRDHLIGVAGSFISVLPPSRPNMPSNPTRSTTR